MGNEALNEYNCALYQGNLVKVIQGNLKWLNQTGDVEDSNDPKFPYYPVRVYFPQYQTSEHFKRNQLVKL